MIILHFHICLLAHTILPLNDLYKLSLGRLCYILIIITCLIEVSYIPVTPQIAPCKECPSPSKSNDDLIWRPIPIIGPKLR